MKKFFLASLLVMFAALFAVVTCAASVSDSLRIGKENYELLGGGEGDTVIRLYLGEFLKGFAEGKNASELTCGDYVSSLVYMTRTKRGQTSYKTIVDNSAHEARISKDERSDGRFAYEVVKKADRVFGGKVNIDNIYCLCEDDGSNNVSSDGVYVYFVTDKGDYVYYAESADADAEYLFPVEKFAECAREAVARADGGAEGERGESDAGRSGVRLGDVCDIAAYEVRESPDAFLIAASVIAAVGTLVLCGFTLRPLFAKRDRRR